MRTRLRSRGAAVPAILLSLVAPAAAQDMGDLLEVLDESVVTGATRSAERAGDSPAMSSVITAEQLRQFGIRRVGDALNFLSLGAFSHDRMGSPEVGMRGVALTRDSNNHVLILLDGIAMNEQAGGAVFLHDIPIDLVDHIEVILGPGSVLYGSSAMLGVINVVTKAGRDAHGVRATTTVGMSPPMDEHGKLEKLTLDSMGHDNHYHLSVGLPFELLGEDGTAVAAIDADDFDGPDFSFPLQPLPSHTDGSQTALGPNAPPGMWGGPVQNQWYRRTTGGHLKLELGDLTWTTRATTTKLASPQMDLYENRAGAYDDPRNYDSHALILSGLSYDRSFTEKVRGHGGIYFGYSRNLRSRHLLGHDGLIEGVPLGVLDPEQCPVGPLGPCRQEAWTFARWLGLELRTTYDWFGDGAYSTMVGVDGRMRTSAYEFVTFDELTGESFGSDPAFTRWHGGGHKIADEHALGAYVQQSLKPWKYLAFNAGARMDADTRIPAEYALDALSPRVAAIATPTEDLSFKLIYSKAFRSPSFLELYVVNGRLLPNRDGLRPERVSSLEAISSLRVDSHAVTLGAFYAEWQDLIELQVVQAQAPIVSRYDNVPGITNYGANLSYETSFFAQALRLGLNTTYAFAERQLSDEQLERSGAYVSGDTVPVTVAPRWYGNARVSYDFEPSTLAVAGGFFGRRIADQAFYGGDPSNLVPRPEAPRQLELRAVFGSTVPNVPEARYHLGINYAFSAYQPYVVGPEQGQPRYLVAALRPAELAFVNRMSVFAGVTVALDGQNPRDPIEPQPVGESHPIASEPLPAEPQPPPPPPSPEPEQPRPHAPVDATEAGPAASESTPEPASPVGLPTETNDPTGTAPPDPGGPNP